MMLTFFCQITNDQHCAANYNWVAEHPKVMDINPPNFLIQSNAKTGEVVLFAQIQIQILVLKVLKLSFTEALTS